MEWAKAECTAAASALHHLPLPPQMLISLLGYQGPARLNHTHHLTQLTWQDIARLDAILLTGVRQLHRLPKSFPRVALQAPAHQLGLNFPSIWEDYSAAAGASWCRILNDEGILGRAARDSLSQAALEFRSWPTTSALPHYPYTMGRVAAILLSSNLIPAGSPDIWLGCQISNDLTTATHPVVDDNGTLQDPQPYPPTHDVLHRLTPLWKHNIHNWDQVLYHPRGSVPHILTMEEFNNRQSLLGLPPPTPALTRALKYLHCLLLSSSLMEFRSLRCSLTKKKLHPTMRIAPLWRNRLTQLSDLPPTSLPSPPTGMPRQLPLDPFLRPISTLPPTEPRPHLPPSLTRTLPRPPKRRRQHKTPTVSIVAPPLRGSDLPGEFSTVESISATRQHPLLDAYPSSKHRKRRHHLLLRQYLVGERWINIAKAAIVFPVAS